jgi:hypothetical protein
MISNGLLEDRGKLLGDVSAATAILDQFLHHAEIITITRRTCQLKDEAIEDADKPKEHAKDDPDRETESWCGQNRIGSTGDPTTANSLAWRQQNMCKMGKDTGWSPPDHG